MDEPKLTRFLEEKDLLILRMPGVIHPTACLHQNFKYAIKKYKDAPYGVMFISLENGAKGMWVLPRKEYRRGGTKILSDRGLFDKTFNRNKIEWNDFFKTIKVFEKKGLAKDVKKLAKDYANFIDKYLEAYSSTMYAAYVTYTLADEIVSELSKKYRLDMASKIVPAGQTAAEQYQTSLVRIASAKNSPQAKKLLEEHMKNFYWIRTNYTSNYPLTISEIKDEIKDIKLDKPKAHKLPSLEEKDKNLLEMLCTVSYWQDMRKRVNQTANFWMFEFIKQASSLLKIPEEDLKFTTPQEFLDILKGKEIKDLHLRCKASAIFTNSSGEETVFVGKEALDLFEKYNKTESISEIKGAVAMPGKVRGRARIVLNVKQDKLHKGEILIASMTRPEFIPLAKLASAIVTNEGGVTSHAAVISRELGIPCIVGTKIATQVINNGDLIELDTDKGIVKIIKRAKYQKTVTNPIIRKN